MAISINFSELKKQVPILDAARLLGLELKTNGDENKVRCNCPMCESDDERAILINIEKETFNCYADPEKPWGDCLELVRHVKGFNGVYQAASWLAAKVVEEMHETEPLEEPVEKPKTGFDPEKYLTTLDFEDAAEKLGLKPSVARLLGIGTCKRGVHKGRIAVAIRNETGDIDGFMSIAEAKFPKHWMA